MTDLELLQAIRTIIKEETAPLHKEMQALKTEALEIKVTQEGIVLPGIQRLAEGHENILEHIQEKIDAKTDKLQDQVDVLTIAVKYHTKEIQELKKAQ